jgi:hypothetical protein
MLIKNPNHHTVTLQIMTPQGRDSVDLHPYGRTELHPTHVLIAGEQQRLGLVVEDTQVQTQNQAQPEVINMPAPQATVDAKSSSVTSNV